MSEEIQRINKMIAKMERETQGIRINKEQLEMVSDLRKQISRFTKAPDALKQFQQGRDVMKEFYVMNQRVRSIAEQFYDKGIIKNREAIDKSVNSFIFSPVPLDFQTHFKFVDTTVSLKKMFEENRYLISQLSIPHISLYQNIFDSIDYGSYKKAEKIVEGQFFEAEEEVVEQEKEIKHPSFFDAAVKIQIYINITENVIVENGDVEQETLWKKVVKPFMETLRVFLMTLAFGNVPVGDMQIVQGFEKMIEVVESYQYSIETTEVEVNGLEITDVEMIQVEETDLEIKE